MIEVDPQVVSLHDAVYSEQTCTELAKLTLSGASTPLKSENWSWCERLLHLCLD